MYRVLILAETSNVSSALLHIHFPAESLGRAAVHTKPLHEPKQIVSFFFLIYDTYSTRTLCKRNLSLFYACLNKAVFP